MENKYSLIIGLVIVLLLVVEPAAAEEIKLQINEQPVEYQLKIIQGRTLVPARVISEYLGGQLEWVPEQQKLKVITNDLGINFSLGSQVAVVNSQVVPLTTAPCLVSGRVYLSLRDLKKIYGGKLIWNPEEKTIDYQSNQVNQVAVETTESGVEVVIKTDFPPDYEVSLLQQPQRLVVDLKETNRSQIDSLLSVNNQVINQIRVSQFQVDPAVVRLVIDLDKFSSYQVVEKEADLVLQIKAEPGIVTSSIRKRRPTAADQPPKIVIDPGHGGEDPGAIGISGIEEKEVNLQIAEQVAELLRQEGYQTLVTRKRDTFIPLERRAQLANQWSADIFISIHANFNYQQRVNGTATYAHWNSTQKNWALAWYVQSETVNRLKLKDNGLKAANFVVLRQTKMPAVLLETAFLSNPREEQLLVDRSFQLKAAKGLVAGIKKYFAKQSSV